MTQSFFYLKSEKQFLRCFNLNSGFIYYSDYRIDLKTGEKEYLKSSDILETLSRYSLFTFYEQPVVLHLFYELGYLFQRLQACLSQTDPLFILLQYKEKEKVDMSFFDKEKEQIGVSLKSYPRFKQYKQQFAKVRENLLAGNCYQINLTQRFYFEFHHDYHWYQYIKNLWSDVESRAAYAHVTYLSSLNRLILSNSPECLFMIKGDDIVTMPIKGTVKVKDKKEAQAWRELKSSVKDAAELDMITDLVRNDLSLLTKDVSYVLSRSQKLKVPNILHQYSLIKSKLPRYVNLKDVLVSLFPGGSITGAPKRKVMSLIYEIENKRRSLYTGSTVLLCGNKKVASINIRTGEIDLDSREMSYGSGGGVTILSDVAAEFDETYIKMRSFIRLLSEQLKL